MKVEVAVLGSLSGLICVRIEVAVLVSPSLIVLMISVDVK